MAIAKPFWSQVWFGPTCWEWMGSKTKDGYGQRHRDGKTEYAHRISLEEHDGERHPDLFVLHACDNPSCVRPDHLSWGTNADNMADCKAKGRTSGIGANMRAKTHCPAGHPYDEVNTLRCAGRRFCRACGRERMRLKRAS